MRAARQRLTTRYSDGDQFCTSCQKTLYVTKKRANQASRGQRLRNYECPNGGGFHLGHRQNHAAKDRRTAYSGNIFTGTYEEMKQTAARMRSW